MRPTSLRFTSRERNLGLQWVAATVVGWAIGFFACEAVETFVATAFVDGLIIGTAIGIAQWLVLRRQVNPVGWWPVLSIVGFGLGKAAGEALTQGLSAPIGHGLVGAVIGLSVGVTQWLVLRRHVEGAAWWVPANVAAWAVAWSIIGSVEGAAGTPIAWVYLAGAIGAGAAGVITGFVLVSLTHRRGAALDPAARDPAATSLSR